MLLCSCKEIFPLKIVFQLYTSSFLCWAQCTSASLLPAQSQSEMTRLPVSISKHTTPDTHMQEQYLSQTHTHTHSQPIASFSLTATMDHQSTTATNQGWKGWRSCTWDLTQTHLSLSLTHTLSHLRNCCLKCWDTAKNLKEQYIQSVGSWSLSCLVCSTVKKYFSFFCLNAFCYFFFF